MKLRFFLLLAASSSLLVLNAGAVPFSPSLTVDSYDSSPDGTPTPHDDNDALPDLNDAVNHLLGTAHADNEDIDPLMLSSVSDDTWIAPSGTGNIALIGLSTGNPNTLGFYTDLGVGAATTPLLTDTGFGFAGDGSVGMPYPGATITTGGPFGFYLESDDGSSTATYYSEPGLNPAGFEHMVTYDLPGLAGESVYVDFGGGPVLYTFEDPVLVGWEDLPFDVASGTLGDDDYDDMIYVYDRVAPANVPSGGTTAVFLALALAGCLGAKRFGKR